MEYASSKSTLVLKRLHHWDRLDRAVQLCNYMEPSTYFSCHYASRSKISISANSAY